MVHFLSSQVTLEGTALSVPSCLKLGIDGAIPSKSLEGTARADERAQVIKRKQGVQKATDAKRDGV